VRYFVPGIRWKYGASGSKAPRTSGSAEDDEADSRSTSECPRQAVGAWFAEQPKKQPTAEQALAMAEFLQEQRRKKK
jgi:hypothetical protein